MKSELPQSVGPKIDIAEERAGPKSTTLFTRKRPQTAIDKDPDLNDRESMEKPADANQNFSFSENKEAASTLKSKTREPLRGTLSSASHPKNATASSKTNKSIIEASFNIGKDSRKFQNNSIKDSFALNEKKAVKKKGEPSQQNPGGVSTDKGQK